MKKIQVFYTYSSIASPKLWKKASFTFDVEDDAADKLLEVSTPFKFDDYREDRRKRNIGQIAYWHASLHERWISDYDKILKITEAER